MDELIRFFDISPIDILGFFAGICVLFSMILRKVLPIKILLLTGAISWLTYGIVQHLLPIVAINVVISLTGILEITRLIRNRHNAKISTT